tara:strand:+ start:1332 stop:3395 length:2064 start_codon:yes stop_codon:yes gene_type:complete
MHTEKHDYKDFLIVNNFYENEKDVLGFDLRLLPELKNQKRKRQAKESMPEWKICGADTETIDGKVWLLSTEEGVWEINNFQDLLDAFYDRKHLNKWKRGGGSDRGRGRGFSPQEFFFWNLKYDAQAIFKLLPDENISELLSIEGKTEFQLENKKIKIKYLEGKYLKIEPVNTYIGQYKLGAINCWDISQFWGKGRLNTRAEKELGLHKIEKTWNGTCDNVQLDISKINEEWYRNLYREDIEYYAWYDAFLAGELARLKRNQIVDANVRFIKPYSVANVAQRSVLDKCKIPTINKYKKSNIGIEILQKALSSYQGGWFETTGSGYLPQVRAYDLASAYPYVMYHLEDTDNGYWVQGDEEEGFWKWAEQNDNPYRLGFAEAFIIFEPNLPVYPLVQLSDKGTLTSPRIVKGWFTLSELLEARKWPHRQFILGDYCYFVPKSNHKPFQPFVSDFYEMKMSFEKGTPSYDVSKILINSAYGKTIQAVNGKIGGLWNPIYASTITGGTRARLAEFIRINEYKAVSIATDGIVLNTENNYVPRIPKRPLEAPHNLGEWEDDGEGELCVLMSGVYSVRKDKKVKTVFRGSASYFLRDFREDGLFGFCATHKNELHKIATVNMPYSAKEARMKKDYSLINVFEERSFTLKATGDSNKRLWKVDYPRTFGDLLKSWFTSYSHNQVDLPLLVRVDNV